MKEPWDRNAGDSGLCPASGVKFADQVKKRAGEAFDYTASGPVAFVEVVRLELPCQYHLGYLVSEKLVIDCLPFGVRYIPSPSSMASPLLTRLPIALP